MANPALLFIAFIIAAFVIYTFASLKFLTKGIDIATACNPSLRDWIRVNGFVASFLGTMFLLNSMSIFFTSDITLRQYLSQFLETVPNKPAMLNLELFLTIMKGMAYFMFFVSVVLLSHILINFKLMKQYQSLFGITPKE
jgi:hypothetical protein